MRSCGLRSGSDGVVTVNRQAVRSTVGRGRGPGCCACGGSSRRSLSRHALFVVDSGHYGL